MTTLHDLNTYVLGLKPARRKKAKKVAGGNGGNGQTAVAAMLSRVKALSAGNGHRAFAMSRPLNYEAPGVVAPIRQPSSMACWATSFTMLANWREQTSIPIESRLRPIGEKWVNLFTADTGASAEQEAEFYAAAGLIAEPLTNPTLEGWEGLLRQYGPLAVNIDVDPSNARAMHQVIVTGIHGDGSPGGTKLTIVDPARGDRRTEDFMTFHRQYEQGAARRTASGRFNNVIHWPKDVRFSGSRGIGLVSGLGGKPGWPPASGNNVGSGAVPWSTYFPFMKGSTYEVDGPYTWSGTGQVLERTADYVKFTLKMPSYGVLNWKIPAFEMIVEATYEKEGKGNLVRVSIDGSPEEDKDAEITSSGSRRTVRPKLTGLSPSPEWITITPDGATTVVLVIRIDGEDREFRLDRKTGSSGLALGLNPWSQSFPFGAGTLFHVDGPASFDGRGRVHERTDSKLKFEINMPAATVLGSNIPKLDLILEANYAKEGSGNQVTLTVNGKVYPDTNAKISTNANGARRTIVPSITMPDVKVEMIAFGPEGADEIDLDVTIDGEGHDFDLERIKTSTSQGGRPTAPARLATSTQADAMKEIAAFAGRTTPTSWKVSRADVANRLKSLVGNPDLVDQGGLNLCGPAAFFHLYARRDPAAYVKYAADLFEKGSGNIGSLKVTPKSGLVSNDYATVAKRMGAVTPVAEWVTLSALRSSENALAPFTGDPDENFGGITTPGEIAKWMRASGVYKSVTDDATVGSSKSVAHATAVRFAANLDVLMLINANIIEKPAGRSFLDAFPNHYIHLLSPVTSTAKGVEFDYWTWGEATKRHAVIDPKAFAENYYGTITGEL